MSLLPLNVVSKITSDDNLEQAYDWLMQQNTKMVVHADILEIRSQWKQRKPQLQIALKNTTFIFQPLRTVEVPNDAGQMEQREIHCAEDQLVMRAINQALQPTLHTNNISKMLPLQQDTNKKRIRQTLYQWVGLALIIPSVSFADLATTVEVASTQKNVLGCKSRFGSSSSLLSPCRYTKNSTIKYPRIVYSSQNSDGTTRSIAAINYNSVNSMCIAFRKRSNGSIIGDLSLKPLSYNEVAFNRNITLGKLNYGRSSVRPGYDINARPDTPTVCLREHAYPSITERKFYMAVFPPALSTYTSQSFNNIRVENNYPTSPIEVSCVATDTYGDCYGEALTAYYNSTNTTPAPKIDITGRGTIINNGKTVAHTYDGSYFGPVDIANHSKTNTFSINNIGSAPLNLSGITITGTDASDFSLTDETDSIVAIGDTTKFSITFKPSGLGHRRAIVNIINNDSDENPYTFKIIGTGVKHVISISKSSDGAEDEDGERSAEFRVDIEPPNSTGQAITGNIIYSGDAINGDDYTGSTSFVIPKNKNSTIINLRVVDDGLDEDTEIIIATIDTLSAGTIDPDFTSASVSITDNDHYSIAIEKSIDGVENGIDAQFTITSTPSNQSGIPITGYITYLGTAKGGTDYKEVAEFSIPDNNADTTITLAGIDDGFIEGDETIIATLSNPTNGTIDTSNNEASLILADNDNYSVSIAKNSDGTENNGGTPTNAGFIITVTPENNTGSAITGNIAYTGTAESGVDYSAGTSMFTIPNGSSTAIISLAVLEDQIIENTETIIATLSNISAGSSLAIAEATASITNDDKYSVSIAKTTDGNEGNNNNSTNAVFTITVSPSNQSGAAISGSISYSGSATEGADYLTGSTSFSIPDGSSTATITLAVNEDDLVEVTESIIATLSNLTAGVTLGTSSASADLTDADIDTGTDTDGITSDEENAAPNSGDGNDDQTKDSIQNLVSSLKAASTTDKYFTIDALDSSCTKLSDVSPTTEVETGSDDIGLTYEAGLVNFTLTGCAVGGSSEITVYFHGLTTPPTTVRKYGKTPTSNNTAIWYTMPDAIITAVTIDNKTVYKAVYTVTDGQIGDDDLVANGIIIDPVGLAHAAAPVIGGGNEVKPIPTLSEWAQYLLILLIAGMGISRGEQRKRR